MKHPSSAMALRRAGSNPLQWLWLSGLMLLGLLCVMPAFAAEDEDIGDDPPARVGRLAEVDGTVWVFAPENGEWIEAARNRPLTTGDRLSTDRDGRAVIRIGSATTVRVDVHSELEVLALDDEKISFRLHSGSLSARLRSREAAREFSVLTEEGRFLPTQTGSYRIDRFDDTSNGTVWSGQMRFDGKGTSLAMNPGNRVEFWREDEDKGLKYQFAEVRNDAFAAWVSDNDIRDGRTASTRWVSPEMTGVEDLDRYGRWDQTTEYGAVWVPSTVAVGWAPYRSGHWAWVRPWGWTWIDDAPWGFAPFHYGRWVSYRGGWGWAPGTYIRRPVYAPALVAWVGGPNFSVSVNFGGPMVGWFPLAPHEVYVPRYRSSPHYWRQVNHPHVSNLNVSTIRGRPDEWAAGHHYRNRDVRNAMTVVSTSTMTRGQPVGPGMRGLDDRALREMRRDRVRTQAPLTPDMRRPTDPRGGHASSSQRLPPSPAEIARPSFGRDGQPRAERPRPNGPPLSATHSNPAAGLIVNPPPGTVTTTRPHSPQPWHGEDRRGGRDDDREGHRDRGRDERRWDSDPPQVRAHDPNGVNRPIPVGGMGQSRAPEPSRAPDMPRAPEIREPRGNWNAGIPQGGMGQQRPQAPEVRERPGSNNVAIPVGGMGQPRGPEVRERPGNGYGHGNAIPQGGMGQPRDDRRGGGGGGGGGDERRSIGQPIDRNSAR